MPTEEFPSHVQGFFDNIEQVDLLSTIHSRVTQGKKGNHAESPVLHGSAIVLLVACWEVFIEDTVVAAYSHLLKHAKTPDVFPENVRSVVAKRLKDNAHEHEIFKLSGEGWRDCFKEHRDSSIQQYLNTFHSPKASNINELLYRTLGIRNITGEWHWKNQSAEKSVKQLQELIDRRGRIAHRVGLGPGLHKWKVAAYGSFLHKIALVTHNRVTTHLIKQTGKQPWIHYSIGSVH